MVRVHASPQLTHSICYVYHLNQFIWFCCEEGIGLENVQILKKFEIYFDKNYGALAQLAIASRPEVNTGRESQRFESYEEKEFSKQILKKFKI